MNYDWDWGIFLEPSVDEVHTNLECLMFGVGWTLTLAVSAWLGAMLLGSIFGILRTSQSRPLNLLAASYVAVFRNIPLIVQLFLFYFTFPDFLPSALGTIIKQLPHPWGSFLPAVLCMTFYGAARICEHVRAGLHAVPDGQLEAGVSLGLSPTLIYALILLPQTFRIISPLLTSELMATIKYSSVALTVGLLELTGQARQIQEATFHIFEAFAAATVCYLLINSCVVLLMSAIERRAAIPGVTTLTRNSPGMH